MAGAREHSRETAHASSTIERGADAVHPASGDGWLWVGMRSDGRRLRGAWPRWRRLARRPRRAGRRPRGGRRRSSSAVAADTAHAAITGELLVARATSSSGPRGLRAAYDEKRARAADGAAREWAETARDLAAGRRRRGKAAEVRQARRSTPGAGRPHARAGRRGHRPHRPAQGAARGAEREAKAEDRPGPKAVEVHEGEPPPKKKGPRKAPRRQARGAAPEPPPRRDGWEALSARGRRLARLLLAACGATPMHVAALDELERVRAGAGRAGRAREIAPEAFARAEQERALALAARTTAGDDALAMHPRRPRHRGLPARARGRAPRARRDGARRRAEVARRRDDAGARARRLARGARARRDRSSSSASSSRASACCPRRARRHRGAARPRASSAARSMAVEARLLCGAARLVVGRGRRASPRPTARAPSSRPALDKATHPRSHRRRGASAGRVPRRAHAGAARRGRRRGSRRLAAGRALGERRMGPVARRARRGRDAARRLPRAASSPTAVPRSSRSSGASRPRTPDFGVQVVVHDARAPPAKDDGDARRAEAAVKALVDGGATPARVDTELAGARAPVVDPARPQAPRPQRAPRSRVRPDDALETRKTM